MSNTLLNPHRQHMEVDTGHYCMDTRSSWDTLSVEWWEITASLSCHFIPLFPSIWEEWFVSTFVNLSGWSKTRFTRSSNIENKSHSTVWSIFKHSGLNWYCCSQFIRYNFFFVWLCQVQRWVGMKWGGCLFKHHIQYCYNHIDILQFYMMSHFVTKDQIAWLSVIVFVHY